MYEKLKHIFFFTLSLSLISATVLPNLTEASVHAEVPFKDEILKFADYPEESEYMNEKIDDFLEEVGISHLNFEELTEEEAEAVFEKILSDEHYYDLENKINQYINELDKADISIEAGSNISTRLLPVAFAAIGVVALRLVVTQGTKAATAYLKKVTKKYSTQYKITFPGSKQLILIQDKKTKKRLFSLDNHSVKLVHKTTGKGYSYAFSAWHFHKSPDMGQHYLMCSSIPKNYKVQKGKCYF